MRTVNQTDLRPWRAVVPDSCADWFSSLKVPWWVAGGWALDLYTGEQSRAHEDLDVGVLRANISSVLDALSSFEVFEAKDGVLTPIQAGNAPRPDVYSLWCRPTGSLRWEVELMLDECLGEEWVYRRCESIRRPLSSVVQRSLSGLPYLAPEIQLLYKARGMRPRDQADFDRIAPRLSRAAQTWLLQALEYAEPAHSWISALRKRGA